MRFLDRNFVRIYHNLYSSANIIKVIKSRRMRWRGHVARIRTEKYVHRPVAGQPEGTGPLERH